MYVLNVHSDAINYALTPSPMSHCKCRISLAIGTLPPSGVTAVQAGPTSILVSWSPSSDATGYRIDYDSSGGHSDSVTVSGGSTEEYTLTGLQNEDTYTVSITATSQHLYSESVPADMSIGLSKKHYYN